MKINLHFFYVLVCLYTQVQATNYVVINLNDSGANSLRAAITSANADASATTNAPHVISFDIFGGGTITLASDLPALDNHITINGQAEQITIAGGTGIRGFYINAGKTVVINNLVVQGANLTSAFGGGIHNEGDLTLMYSTVKSNTISGTGQGGGISNSGTGTLTLSNCTVSGNTSSNTGGGIVSYGTLNIMNSTIADNSGNDGGGIMSYSDLVMINCTVVNNTGGGIYFIASSGGDIALLNTISVGSITGSDLYTDVTASVVSGYGLYGTKTVSATLTGPGNSTGSTMAAVFGTNVLSNNGGSTQTIALILGSPAIDAGTTAAGVPASDQAGQSRSGAVDIGSFEYQPLPTSTFHKLSADLVTVYSNPGNGLFEVEIGAGIQGVYDWKVIDMKGKLLQSRGNIQKGNGVDMQSINLSGQLQGTYLLIITTEKGIVNKSLVKL
jgi:hypothetical protein